MLIRRNQSGFALLIFMLVLISAYFLAASGLLTQSLQQQNKEKRAKNFQLLSQAKEALLSYAIDYRMRTPVRLDRIGILPCPDIMGGTNSNGNSDTSCGIKGVNTIGYFPYKTVGLGKTEDASKECFWYVVSGNYKNEPYGLLNRDSVGYLKVVDENGALQHGSNSEDYPIALIISPGKNIGKNRAEASGLSDCQANYSVDNYLEFFQGGAVQQYSSTLVGTPDTEWTFVQPSAASTLNDVDYNDQVIAIYKDELWDKIEKLGDLSFDNVNSPSYEIEKLTKKLAECIAFYGNDTSSNPNKNLPYPSSVDLDATNTTQDEYVNSDNYNDNSSLLHGRFPQVLDSSVRNASKFVYDSTGNSYCENATMIPGSPPIISYNEDFWDNWKDHFFLIVSEDFKTTSSVLADTSKCQSPGGGCITVDGKTNKIAAMVIYSGHAETERNWKWNGATASDNKDLISDYLEGDNAALYTGGNQNFNLIDTDYSYCVEYDSSFNLSAKRCKAL